MNTLALLTLAALSTVGPRSSATATRGDSRTTAKVDGRSIDISVKKGRTRTEIGSVTLGAQCNAKKVAEVISREVSETPDAFPTRSSDVRLETVPDLDALRDLERGMGTILSAGTHGVNRHGGATRVPGFRANVGSAPPKGRSSVMKVVRRGGTSTFTLQTGKDGSKTVTRVTTLPSGVEDTTTVRFGTDGRSSVQRVLSFGKGDAAVSWTQNAEYGSNGNALGSEGSVHRNGAVVVDGLKNENPSGGGGGGAGENEETGGSQGQGGLKNENPSGGGGGGAGENEENGGSQGQGGPTLDADGSLNVPGFDISGTDVATIINWNRLGAAVTTPDPTKDGESGPTKGNGGKPCAGLDEKGFDPNPNYLMPNKQGFVSDPVPALLGKP